MNETASLADALASSMPDLTKEGRGKGLGTDGYRATMPHLHAADPDRARKIAWVTENVSYAYVDNHLRYDAEAMAASFDVTRGLCADYDELFHPDAPKSHASREALMEGAHVPHEVADAVGRMGDAPAEVARYADELQAPHPRSCVLVGDATSTVYAAWLVGGVPGGLFCEYSELVSDIDAAEGRLGEAGAQSIANQLRDVSLLVLDELDAARLDSRLVSLLYPPIRHRHMNGLPTIVTCSVPLEVMERKTLNNARSDEDRDAARRLFAEIINSTGRNDAERRQHAITCGGAGGR